MHHALKCHPPVPAINSSAVMLLECKDCHQKRYLPHFLWSIAAAPTVSQHESQGVAGRGSAESCLASQVFLDHFHGAAPAEDLFWESSTQNLKYDLLAKRVLRNRVADPLTRSREENRS